MTESDALAGTTIGGCRIIKKIGQGGMGAVYTAQHLTLGKTVCVKLLSPELAREQRNVEFFMREARSAAKLEHPNIVRVYSFGQEQGFHYIVMSFIEGVSLADIVARSGPMDVDTATDIMLEVFDALKHAHSKSIIHRDIKPSNILLGSDGRPSIVDFGLARSISEEKLLTMAGEMIGTAYFMSPEQGLAGSVDHRADLYSAGATFFYLLTGRYPFEGKTYIEVVHKHIGDPLPSIMVLRPDLPLWVSRVMDLLMRKNPKDRYQSAEQVIEEIKRLRDAEKSGTAATNSRSIEIPELSKRLAEEKAGKEAAEPEAPAAPREQPPAAPSAAPKKPSVLKRDNKALNGILKTAAYCVVTFAAAGCFMAAGAAAAPKPGLLHSIIAAFTEDLGGAGGILAAGFVLSALSVLFRPFQSAVARFFMVTAAGLLAYAGVVYAPGPAGADTPPKALYFVKLALDGALSYSNFPAYSLCLFIAASKMSLKRHWAARVASVTAFLLSLMLTCIYFSGGLPVIFPLNNYFAAAGAATLIGIGIVLAKKQFSVIFNASVFFFAANALALVMFTAPHIDSIVQKQLRIQADHNRQTAMAEFGVEDALENAPVPTAAAKKELTRAAAKVYYQTLAVRMERNILKTAGLLFLSLFLLLMADILFAEAVIQAGEGAGPMETARRLLREG